jgi:hypothetical protein
MTKLTRAEVLLVAVAMCAACAACTSDVSSSPTTLPTPQATTASTRPPVVSDVPPPPEVGQCRNTLASHLGPHDWVDNTPVVDCSKTHTLETAEVIRPVQKLTRAQAKQLAGSCGTPAWNYLGITFHAVRTIPFPLVYWPSRAQRAAGQNWLRCDIGVKADTRCCRRGLAPQTGSLQGAVSSDPVRFQMCIDQVPDPSRAQPLTSCKKPHRAELLPDFLDLEVTHYPSAATLSRKGRSGCAKFVAQRKDLDSLVITLSWTPRAEWSGGTLEGDCWIHRKTGLLPPIR